MTSVPKFAASRNARLRGSTLLEVAVAAVIIGIVSMAGTSYYLYARTFEILAIQEQTAFNIAELEVESWQAEGYGASAGYTTTTPGWGYNSGWAVGEPRRVNYPLLVVREGMTYRVSATLLFNLQGSAPTFSQSLDFRQQDTSGGVTWQYRRIVTTVEWGALFGNSLSIETRISQ
jgi:Tfp pilus assembly protein PilE